MAVQTAILAQITATNDCMMVTNPQLGQITTLDLSGQSIQTLQAGDFAGLTALTSLDLSNNNFPALPNIFSGLTTLTGVDVSGNPQDDSPSLYLHRNPNLKQLKHSHPRNPSIPTLRRHRYSLHHRR